jgi:UDP-galactopyranose mutase
MQHSRHRPGGKHSATVKKIRTWEGIMQESHAIIAFSHLRWDFVYQRPQQLLSRMAAKRRVIFIEEPVEAPSDAEDAFLERITPEPNVVVYKPHSPVAARGFHDAQMPVLHKLMQQVLEREKLKDYVLWFYTPMALPLAETLRPSTVVYDCMDELSAFLNAPPQLLEREERLLSLADTVFTGGPSLYRAKKDRHANVHCFPSSVDAKHFSAAASGIPEAGDQAGLARPRLGFFGVIDERIDLALLEKMADAHPEWQIAMVGPVVKIDPASLPRRPNLHYYGQRSYKELPQYLAGWDVCIQPFARNQATKFISPTKTLEYMAAERMIVSTPITDVAEPYGDIVFLGQSAEDFIEACERALAAPEDEKASRLSKMREVLARTSWDRTVASMEQVIARVMTPKAASVKPPKTTHAARTTPAPRPAQARREYGTIIAGAGPTGLSAAYHLGDEALLLEQKDRVGGWCRSIEEKGFTFDYAGHIMFSNEPYVHELYKMLLGDNVHWQDREAWIYSKNVYTRYPFQGALYGLPPAVIKECIVGAIESRFGPLASASNSAPKTNGHAANGHANGHASNGHAANGKILNGAANGECAINDCCADGILENTARMEPAPAEPRNFEEFIYKVWGAGIAKHFAIPYNRKLWAVPLSEMETSWLGGRVPLPDLGEMIEGALSPVPKPMGPNARFGYPLRGGFQALMDGFLPYVQDRLRLNTRVTSVEPEEHTLRLSSGEELKYDHLISTLPLPALIRGMGQAAPPDIRAAAASLRHVSVRCVHLGIGRENLTDKHWIYYPEDSVFHRIFVQGNASPHCNPPGGFGLTCEITYSEHKPLPCDGQALIERCIADCLKVGIFKPEDPVIAATQVDLPYAYVVYDHGRAQAVSSIREWLEERDIILSGRYSEWEYYNSDHAFIAGKKAASKVRQRQGDRLLAGLAAQSWQPTREVA